jgi:hypothetical protein
MGQGAATTSVEPAAVWAANPPRASGRDVLALFAWTLAVLVVFGRAALLREALFYFDITEINFPYRQFLAGQYRQGSLSRWHPGLQCGLPLFAESQAGYFHPLKLLYLVLPTWQAFNLDTVLSVWLAGAAAYGWLRGHVGVAGALAGAGTFGLGGFTFAHLIHTSMVNALPSVPLAIWALEWTWRSGRLAGVSLGALAIACQVFAGHLQDTILTGLLVGLCGLHRASELRAWPGRRFAMGTAVGMVLLAGLLAAVQWVPSKHLVDRSPRTGGLSWEDLTFGSWSPELLPTLLVREAYGTRSHDTDWMDGYYPYQEMNVYLGALGLALAAVGAGAYRDRWVGRWLAIGLVGAVFMLGRYTFLFDVMHRIPVMNSGRIPVRYHLWVSMAAAALVAVGVDRLARPGAVRLRAACGTIGLLLAACVPLLYHVYGPAWTDATSWTSTYHRARFAWLGDQLAGAAARNAALLVGGLLVAWRAARQVDPRRRARLAALLPLLVLADLAATHRPEVATVDPSYWTDPPRSAAKILADPSHARVYGLGALSAGEPGYAVRAQPFFDARDTLAWSLAPVWGLRTSNSITPIYDRRMYLYDRASLAAGVRFDLEDVTHLLAGGPTDFARLGRPTPGGTALIYRNPNARPRARLVGRPAYVADADEATRTLVRLGTEARDRLIVEDPSRPLAEGAEARGSARVVEEEPERVVVAVAAETPAYLFLADTFDPGWTATVDGRPAPIRPAHVAFRAVYVGPGRHTVVFRYEPAGWRAGLALSGIGVALGVALLVVRPRRAVAEPLGGASRWPRRWPAAAALAVVLVLLLSAVRFGPGGRPGVQSRWDASLHRFTWGAKVEAIRPPPPEPF